VTAANALSRLSAKLDYASCARHSRTFTTIIKEETDLDDADALNLAGALADHMLSAIVDRLQVSNPSLLKDLLQTMERREQSH
jgi:hypothetical protein